MFNKKVIVICGYARGGTNIVWNLMQSHPNICSPVHETGKLFKKSFSLKLCHIMPFSIIGEKKLIDRALFNFKLSNLEHPDNKFLTEEKIYTKDEIASTSLCLKSVNHQIDYTETLLKAYPDLYLIGLTRNGYALADGLIRRGKTAQEAGKLYTIIAEKLKILSEKVSNYKLIKFEDALEDPFSMSKELFDFVDEEPNILKNIRLKSKKLMRNDGKHRVGFGDEHRKYWFNKKSIEQILDPEINKKQLSNLNPKIIEAFYEESGSTLEYFGYKKMDPFSFEFK